MSKFTDHAAPLLKNEPSLDDSQRADLWSLFHQSADANELAGHLSELSLRGNLKGDLIRAKRKPATEPDDLDRAVALIHRMAAIDSKVLDTAEKHPHVLGHMVDEANSAGKERGK